MTTRIIVIGLSLAALGLIGWGAWWIYPPAGLLAVGGLLWLDLSRMGRARREESDDKPER
jgi:hypothetical protein